MNTVKTLSDDELWNIIEGSDDDTEEDFLLGSIDAWVFENDETLDEQGWH